MFRSKRKKYEYPRVIYRRERRVAAPTPRRRKRRGIAGLLGEFVSWCAFLLLVSGCVVGGAWYVIYTRFDDAVRTLVESRFRQAYPHHRVTLRAARRIEGQGIELRGLTISERRPDGTFAPVVELGELLLQCNAVVEEMLSGNIAARQVILRELTLHARRDENGVWNVAQLLPVPRFSARQLPVVIENSRAVLALPGLAEDAPLTVAIDKLNVVPQLSEASAGTAPARAWSVSGNVRAPQLRNLQIAGEYDVATQVWRASGQAQGLQISRDSAPFIPVEYRSWSSLCEAVLLTVDANFQATNENANGKWCTLQVEGQVGGRIEDPRLPLPLTELKADFHSDGRSLQIQSLTARAGQAALEGSCRIDAFHEEAPCSLTLSARRLNVDRQLVASLPQEWREMWGKVSPEGLVDAQLELNFDGREITHRAVVDCHDISFAYHKFPYRLTNGQGRITWQNGVLKFEQLRAYASGRRVDIEGEIENPGPEYTGYVEVKGNENEPVPIDDRLIAALPDAARRVVNQLHPQGFIVPWGRFERRGSNPAIAKKQLRILVRDANVNYELFPYPLTKIRGEIVMEDDQWTLKDLEGANDSAWVLCNGGWGPNDKGVMRLALNFSATDVPLEDELRDALRPDARNVWNSLQPRGTLDKVDARVEFDGLSRKTQVEVTATKQTATANVPGRTIAVKPIWLPYQLDELEGTVHFHDGVTQWRGVRGHHGATVMLMDGSAGTTDEGLWRVGIDRLHLDHVEMSNDLLSALPKRLGEAVTRLNITGPVSMSGALVLEGRKGQTAPQSTQWDLEFDMENGGLHCGVRLDHVHGGMKLVGVVDGKGLTSSGWVDVDSLFYQGIQCTKIQGPISLNDERLGLGEWVTKDDQNARPRPMNGKIFGGDLMGNAEVILSGDFPFHLESFLSNADLATISREATSQRPDVSGKTFVDLRLSGNRKGSHTFQGAGTVQLRDADVYELPVLVDMLKLLRVKVPDRTAFTSSDVRYHIEGDRVYFDELHFEGDVLSLDGSGDMTLDKNVNLTLHTSLGGNDFRDIIFRPLLKEAGKQLLEIRVTGTLDNPLINTEPLRNIRENIQNIFPVPNATQQRPVMSRLPEPTDGPSRATPPR